MGRLKHRDERRTVTVRARLRTDAGWSDVTIANVSSRGMMLRSTVPLEPRTFIEVRKQNVVVVGRIVWSHGLQCGISTQDRVDVAGLLSARPCVAAPVANDRRSTPRERDLPKRRPGLHEQLERSRRWARAIDFASVAALAAMAGAGLVATVSGAFAQPLEAASSALGGR